MPTSRTNPPDVTKISLRYSATTPSTAATGCQPPTFPSSGAIGSTTVNVLTQHNEYEVRGVLRQSAFNSHSSEHTPLFCTPQHPTTAQIMHKKDMKRLRKAMGKAPNRQPSPFPSRSSSPDQKDAPSPIPTGDNNATTPYTRGLTTITTPTTSTIMGEEQKIGIGSNRDP